MYQVVAFDWTPPYDVIGEFENKDDAHEFAERMDELALRSYVREKPGGES